MTQDEFNIMIVTELRNLATEVYRSTKSEDWHDLSGLRDRLELLYQQLPAVKQPSTTHDWDMMTTDGRGPGQSDF